MKTAVFRRLLLALFFLLLSMSPNDMRHANAQPVSISSEEIDKTLSLQKREEAIVAREKEIEQREKALAELKKEIDGKLGQIATLQKDVTEKLAAIRQEQDASFKNLIKVYSAMSASKLGPLFNKMSDENVAEILRAMKAEQVAQIIPKLDSEKAVNVSRLLGRFE